MIKIFSRINDFKGSQNKYLKQFYVRCLRILLTSNSLDDFTDTLKEILITVMSETDGWVNTITESPSEFCRSILLNKIKGIKIDELNSEDYNTNR